MKVSWSENRLYKIVIENYIGMCMLSKAEEQTWLWHSRLGHVNSQTLHTMSEKEMAIGIPKLTQPKAVCNGCLLAKQARKPFSQKTEFGAEKKLDLIHADLCGPISPTTPAGNMYVF